MSERISAERLAELREIAGKAMLGSWSLVDPSLFLSGVRLRLYGRFAESFDPPTVLALLDRIAEQDAELAAYRESEAKLAEIRATVENPHIPREQLRPRLLTILDGGDDDE